MVEEEKQKDDDDVPPISMKTLFIKVFLPFFFICLTYHGNLILYPIFLRKMFNASDSFIGLAATVGNVGDLCSSIPVGKFIASYGTRQAELMATTLVVLAYVFFSIPSAVELTCVYNFVLCAGFNCFFLAQHTFLTANVPKHISGRVFAFTGGTWQVSGIIGALMIALFVHLSGLYMSFLLLCPIVLTTMTIQYFFFHDEINTGTKSKITSKEDDGRKKEEDVATTSMESINVEIRTKQIEIIYDFRKELCALGGYGVLLMLCRFGRIVLIPLTGMAIGLSVTNIAIVTAASFFCASLVFPLSGYVMDKYGRKVNCILTPSVMACGFGIMIFAKDFTALLIACIVIGFGNGMSTGLIMALGGDYAPNDERRGPFLSIFKLVFGTGQLIGPVFAGVVSDLFGVSGGAIALTICCCLNALWGIVFVKTK